MSMMLSIIMMWVVMLTQSAVKRTFLASCLLHLAHLDGLGVQDDVGAGQGHVGQSSQDEVGHVGGDPALDLLLTAGLDQVGLHCEAGEVTAGSEDEAGLRGETTGVRQGLQVEADRPTFLLGEGDVDT